MFRKRERECVYDKKEYQPVMRSREQKIRQGSGVNTAGTTLRRVLHKRPHLSAYKVQILQELKPVD
jgi:hypothetical protein